MSSAQIVPNFSPFLLLPFPASDLSLLPSLHSRATSFYMPPPIPIKTSCTNLSTPDDLTSTSTRRATSPELSSIDAVPSEQTNDQLTSAPATSDVVAAQKLDASKLESQEPEIAPIKLDIEHLQVDDDPRMWSSARKNSVLA